MFETFFQNRYLFFQITCNLPFLRHLQEQNITVSVFINLNIFENNSGKEILYLQSKDNNSWLSVDELKKVVNGKKQFPFKISVWYTVSKQQNKKTSRVSLKIKNLAKKLLKLTYIILWQFGNAIDNHIVNNMIIFLSSPKTFHRF